MSGLNDTTTHDRIEPTIDLDAALVEEFTARVAAANTDRLPLTEALLASRGFRPPPDN